MKKNKAPICEIFSSIQGEGKSLGKISTFVRFFGCNLRCRFNGTNCDTPHAVINEQDKVKYLNPDELNKIVKEFPGRHIVFTGGEPMLYQKFIISLMLRLCKSGKNKYTAEIETNGTISAIPNFTKHIKQFNISPKLKSSNQEDGYDIKRINYEALNTMYLPHKSYFKFVVSNRDDIIEIKNFMKKYPKMEVYFMPEGTTRKEIIKNSLKVVKYCIANNVNFSPREHIIIWNKKKGV